MANVTFTPQDYTSTLAMLFHEAGGPAVQSLLRRGDDANALGYVSGLIDTWANRSAATGTPMWKLMNQPNQISHWDSSQIQEKANTLDPRIKALADAYLTNRANGGQNFNPGVVNYMNTEFVKDDNPNGSWKSWYDPKNVVGAYGDYKAGRNSLQTEFITQPKKQPVPEYSFSFDKSLKLSPTDAANKAYGELAGRISPVKPPAPGGDGFGAGTNVSGNVGNSGFGEQAGGVLETDSPYYFTQGNFAQGGNYLGPGSNNLGGATPLGPPPGNYDFANGGTPGGIGDPNFGAGITPGGPPAPAPGPYDFGSGVAGGDTPNGSFGAGIGQPSSTNAPTIGAPPGSSIVQSLYNAILQRPGDAAGVQHFDAELDAGRMDLNAIQAALAASPEAQTLGAPSATRTYSPLETVFARQLDRAPDAAAIQAFGAAPNIDAVEAQVYGAPEAQTYRSGLGDLAGLIRAPSTGALGPTPGQSITATPGIGEYDFASNYLRANADVAAAGMNPWEHFLRFGAQEGRAFNTAGDKFDASKYLLENADVRDAGQDALTHYLTYGAAEGRDAPIIGANGTTRDIGSLGLTPTITASLAQYLQPQGMAPNVPAPFGQTVGATDAPTIGPQDSEFAGTFNPTEYLTANQDVAQAGMDPLQHYLKYGFAEGRAINPGGAHINQGFDPSAYLQANPDVAAAKLDPLAHYLLNGASEGRAAPTGSNPYSFSNFNVSQGLGPVGPGAFGLSGVTGGAGSPMPSFGGQNVSQGVPNGSFGAGIIPNQTISPFGFSGANVSGGLGATAQSLGGSYGVTSAMDLGLGGSGGGAGSSSNGTISPYGFGGDVSGFDVNGGGGGNGGGGAPSTGFDDGSMAAAGFDEKGSELAFLRGQEQNIRDMNESAKLFGQQITNVAPGNQTNYALGAINTPIAPIQQTPFTPVNMSGVFAPMPTAAFMPRFTF